MGRMSFLTLLKLKKTHDNNKKKKKTITVAL